MHFKLRLQLMPLKLAYGHPELGGTSSDGSPTYGARAGTYVKVGKLVMVSYNLGVNALTGVAGAIMLTGLPFIPSNAITYYIQPIGEWSGGSMSFPASILSLEIRGGSNRATIWYTSTNSGGGGALTPAQFGSGTTIWGVATYQTDQ